MKISKIITTPGDIIILHKGTKNQDQMLCCSGDIARVGCNYYCWFWAIFSPFTRLIAQKNEKNPGDIIS